MRTFHLVRDEDVSGVSGTEPVVEGVIFENGQVVIHWITATPSLGIYKNVEDLLAVHGHDGRTRLVYEKDEEESTLWTTLYGED
jgi:hypothetical protein